MAKGKRYRSDSEGTVYERRRTTPVKSRGELEEIKLRLGDPMRDVVTECEALALEVLSYAYDTDVTLSGKHPQPCIDGAPLPRPLPGSTDEIVIDAFDLLDYANSVKVLERSSIEIESADPHVQRNLTNTSIMLGQFVQRLRIRWDGMERAARIGMSKDVGSDPTYLIEDHEGAAEAIRQWVDEDKRGVPRKERSWNRRKLEKRFGVSKSVINRWKEELKK